MIHFGHYFSSFFPEFYAQRKNFIIIVDVKIKYTNLSKTSDMTKKFLISNRLNVQLFTQSY